MTVFSAAQEGVFGRRRDFAALDFNAANGTIFAPSTFTRASGATRVNQRGHIEEVGADVARWEYDPALTYNLAPNPWADGGDNPPTLPFNMGVQPFAGITPQYLGRGVRNGIPYTSWRVNSNGPAPTDQVGHIGITHPVIGTIPAALGDVFTAEFLIEITRIGPTTSPGLPQLRPGIRGYSLDGLTLTDNYTVPAVSHTRTFADGPIIMTQTMINPSTAWYKMVLVIVNSPAGLTHDYDFDIGFPITIRGSTPLTNTVPFEKLIERRNGVAVYGLRGLLLEESSQNLHTNPRLEGFVEGAPGTPPTGDVWNGSNVTGFAATTTGKTYSGLPGIEVRCNFTPSGSGPREFFRFGDTTEYAATQGQTFTFSAFIGYISGTIPASGIRLHIQEVDSAGVNIFGASSQTLLPASFTNNPISQRISVTRTISSASCAYVKLSIQYDIAAGVPLDFTIGFAGPQLEQLGESTSLILPPVGSPGASIRARDNFALPLMLPNLSRGTMAVRGQRISNKTHPTTKYGPVLNSGTTWNGVFGLFWTPNQARPSMQINSNGVAQAARQAPSGAAGAAYTAAIAWGDGSALMSFDGEPAVLDAAAASPTVFTTARGNGLDASATGTANFILKFLRIWGRKLSSAQVQQESARTE